MDACGRVLAPANWSQFCRFFFFYPVADISSNKHRYIMMAWFVLICLKTKYFLLNKKKCFCTFCLFQVKGKAFNVCSLRNLFFCVVGACLEIGNRFCCCCCLVGWDGRLEKVLNDLLITLWACLQCVEEYHFWYNTVVGGASLSLHHELFSLKKTFNKWECLISRRSFEFLKNAVFHTDQLFQLCCQTSTHKKKVERNFLDEMKGALLEEMFSCVFKCFRNFSCLPV